MMVPLYAAGILVAVLLARRWFGRSPRAVVRGAGAALLIIAMCTLVGIAEVANSAAYDYRLQTEHIELVHDMNHTGTPDAGTARQTADLDRRLCRECARRRNQRSGSTSAPSPAPAR